MKLKERIYADYFAPSRFEEYGRLLKQALDAGFRHYTVHELYSVVSRQSPELNDKVFVHRHDVDTDSAAAGLLFKLEKQFGVKSSYYFRLNTLDMRLMSEIHEFGSEVGYHYEEIATYSKRFGLNSKPDVLEHIARIRDEFEKNFLSLERHLGFKIRTVASHGDFVNRAIGAPNWLILQDRELRERLLIECEAYDDIVLSSFDAYLSDGPLGKYSYLRGSPFDALSSKKRICLLTHPRNWRANVVVNTLDNVTRVVEGFQVAHTHPRAGECGSDSLGSGKYEEYPQAAN